MHPECFQFVRQFATPDPVSIIEIGSRDLNGSVRPLFPNAGYVGLDLYPGPAVDIVIDAEHFEPGEPVDIVLCLEVLEHAVNWKQLVAVGASWLKADGRFIITCAGPGRPEHSAIDGQPVLAPGEYYRNVSAAEVAAEMQAAGLGWVRADKVGQDTQAIGWKISRD